MTDIMEYLAYAAQECNESYYNALLAHVVEFYQ